MKNITAKEIKPAVEFAVNRYESYCEKYVSYSERWNALSAEEKAWAVYTYKRMTFFDQLANHLIQPHMNIHSTGNGGYYDFLSRY